MKTLRHNFQIIKNYVNKDKPKGKFIINNVTLVKILKYSQEVKITQPKRKRVNF